MSRSKMYSIWLPCRNENLLVSKSSNAKSVIQTLTSIFKASKTARPSPVGKKETLNLTYIYIYIHMKEFLLIPVDFVARIGYGSGSGLTIFWQGSVTMSCGHGLTKSIAQIQKSKVVSRSARISTIKFVICLFC